MLFVRTVFSSSRCNHQRARTPKEGGQIQRRGIASKWATKTDGSLYRNAFGEFVKVKTWDTRSPDDEREFFLALDTIVRDRNFNPEQMAEFFRQTFETETTPDSESIDEAIEHYLDAAWAVKRYLESTGM